MVDGVDRGRWWVGDVGGFVEGPGAGAAIRWRSTASVGSCFLRDGPSSAAEIFLSLLNNSDLYTKIQSTLYWLV